MNKKQRLMTMAGAALLAAFQAQAQFNYVNGDLLLNFRDYISYTTVPDVSVNLGSITAFSALTGTTILDNGVNNGYTPVFAASELQGVFNTTANSSYSGSVGFTAAATTSANNTSWVTRVQSGPSLTPPSPASGPMSSTSVNTLTSALLNIGNGAVGTSSTTYASLDASGAIVSVPSSQALSYQGSATVSTSPSQLDYNGAESVSAANGGLLESVSTSGSTVYSALWEVPVTAGRGSSPSDTYLGYFTFDNADDIISFTSVNAAVAVPEPAAYGVLAGAGLLLLALRRQLRSLAA